MNHEDERDIEQEIEVLSGLSCHTLGTLGALAEAGMSAASMALEQVSVMDKAMDIGLTVEQVEKALESATEIYQMLEAAHAQAHLGPIAKVLREKLGVDVHSLMVGPDDTPESIAEKIAKDIGMDKADTPDAFNETIGNLFKDEEDSNA